MLLFDSWYDQYKGVVCVMAVIDGMLRKGEGGPCGVVINADLIRFSIQSPSGSFY